MALKEHLRELRNRLIKSAVATVLGAVLGFMAYEPFMQYITEPLQRLAESGCTATINYSSVGGSFNIMVEVSLVLGLVLASPVWLYQLWAFVTPALHRTERRYAVGFLAAAVPPYLYKSDDNPDGGLDDATIEQFQGGVTGDRIAFLEEFTSNFFAAGDRTDLISEPNRAYHRAIAEFASPKGTLDCITAFGRTDFRDDVQKVSDAGIPTLVIHGDADAIVPFEVSGKRSHESIEGSRLALIEGGPHGLNATHPDEFNAALLDFLKA